MSEASAGRERPQIPVPVQDKDKKDTPSAPKSIVLVRHPKAGRGL